MGISDRIFIQIRVFGTRPNELIKDSINAECVCIGTVQTLVSDEDRQAKVTCSDHTRINVVTLPEVIEEV